MNTESQSLFLATTALDEFWEPHEEILFLGTWCTRFDRKDVWSDLNYRILPYPWDDRKKFYEAAAYLDRLNDRFIEELSRSLNRIHALRMPERYWRLLIGPWLICFLHSTYDKYVQLRCALNRCQELQTIVMDPADYQTPFDTWEALMWLFEDRYNLQLYSQLLDGLGYRFPSRRVRERSEARQTDPHEGIVALAQKWLQRSMIRLRHQHILILGIQLSRPDRLKVLWKTGFKSWFVPSSPFPLNREDVPDPDLRSRIRLSSETDFERVFQNLLIRNIPIAFVEGFSKIRRVATTSRSIPSVVVSNVGWYANELVKVLAAESQVRGGRVVALQCGGGYGVYRSIPYEMHEQKIADRYGVWGWAAKGGKQMNLPSARIGSVIRKVGKSVRTRGPGEILYVGSAEPRYLYRFSSSPTGSQGARYAGSQRLFLSACGEEARRSTVFKGYPNNWGVNSVEELRPQFPEVRWDDRRSIVDLYKACGLVVYDHCSTGFLETLAMDLPTVLYWESVYFEERVEATEYLGRLRSAGILFHCPRAAGEAVKRIRLDPEGWWSKECIQDARSYFVNRFAQTGPAEGLIDLLVETCRTNKRQMMLSKRTGGHLPAQVAEVGEVL